MKHHLLQALQVKSQPQYRLVRGRVVVVWLTKCSLKGVIVTVMVGVNLIPFHPSILLLAILMPGRAWEN